MVFKELPEAKGSQAEDMRRQGFVLQVVKEDKGLVLYKKSLIDELVDSLIGIDDDKSRA